MTSNETKKTTTKLNEHHKFVTKRELELVMCAYARNFLSNDREIKNNVSFRDFIKIIISYAIIREWWDPNKKGPNIELLPDNIAKHAKVSNFECVYVKN